MPPIYLALYLKVESENKKNVSLVCRLSVKSPVIRIKRAQFQQTHFHLKKWWHAPLIK